MNTHLSRREMLKLVAALAGGVGLVGVQRFFASAASQSPQAGLTPQAYMPLISKSEATPTPTATATPTQTSTPTATSTQMPGTVPKVIHIHSPSATSWDFSSGWYGDYVNQTKVNEMVDKGLTELTGQATVSAAWAALLPGYSAGKGIAIKVNFNNSTGDCADSDNVIDAVAEPVKAMVRGMKLAGVREQDIWIYDAVRVMPGPVS